MYRELMSSVASIKLSGICVFSIKLMKSVVSFMQDSCFISIFTEVEVNSGGYIPSREAAR